MDHDKPKCPNVDVLIMSSLKTLTVEVILLRMSVNREHFHWAGEWETRTGCAEGGVRGGRGEH